MFPIVLLLQEEEVDPLFFVMTDPRQGKILATMSDFYELVFGQLNKDRILDSAPGKKIVDRDLAEVEICLLGRDIPHGFGRGRNDGFNELDELSAFKWFGQES